MATRLPNASRSAACDAIVDRLDLGAAAGTVQIRSGSQPASANDAATGTLLATVTLVDPAFGAASNGVATASDPVAVTGAADGTAGWFRARDSDGNTVIDGNITATGGGGDMTLNTTTIATGVAFDITSWTVTVPAG